MSFGRIIQVVQGLVEHHRLLFVDQALDLAALDP